MIHNAPSVRSSVGHDDDSILEDLQVTVKDLSGS
jgi:hypothetical protein